MSKNSKNFLIFIVVVLVVAFLFIFLNSKEEKSVSKQDQPPTPFETVKYFTPSVDKITITASDEVLYAGNPSTTLSYYALDDSNQRVNFKEEDRAFVRIMGVSHFYNDNTEIFHPENPDGSKNSTIFSGDITITGGPGVYTLKVCLGETINLNEEGVMVWPWGCFEDGAFERIEIVANNN